MDKAQEDIVRQITMHLYAKYISISPISTDKRTNKPRE